jgi:hypothetical protein
LDEWIYFLKNSEVKDEFKAKGLKEAGEVLDIMRLPRDDQYSYNRYLEYLSYKASEVLSLKSQLEEHQEEMFKKRETEIREDERNKEKVLTIQNMILNGLDNQTISSVMNVPVQKIEEIRRQLETT